jgi:DNA processing protein
MGTEMLVSEGVVHQLALTRVNGVGGSTARKLIKAFGDARSVFQASEKELLQTGIKEDAASAIVSFHDLAPAQAELERLASKGIRSLFLTDKDYPGRLQEYSDLPPLLYYKGNADLNAAKIIAVVGTRGPSDYGREATAQLIRQLARPGLLIISGLALGIDAAAHTTSLESGVPTVGVLGHGFGHLYPSENRGLAKAMLQNGGLLTSLPFGEKPEDFHFPDRNKIVAALCDALIVVESAKKGGSLLTVRYAKKYGKPVYAVPGRLMDIRSAGCNWLIRQGTARILTSGDQIPADLGWEWPAGGAGIQTSLRLSSSEAGETGPEAAVLALLKQADALTIDELGGRMGLPPSSLALSLVNLELRGLVSALPGKRYKLNSAIGRN